MNKWFFYWFDNLKMQRKIVLGVIIVTLVAVVSLEAYSYFRLKDISYQLAGERLSTQAQQALAVSVEVVQGHIDTLKTLALSPSIIDAVTIANTSYNDRSRAEIESQVAILDQAWKNEESSVDDLVAVISNNQVSQLLLAFQDEFPQEIEVFITDIQGLNIAMTNRTGDYFQADEAWWQGAYQDGSGSVFLGAVDYDDSAGAWAMDVGVPIRSRDGTQVIGVLRGTIDISVVFETFSSVTIGDTEYAVLIDKEGKVLYANNPNWLMQIAPEEFIAQIGDQRHTWQQGVDLEGNPALLATDSLDGFIGDGLGWTILLGQDISEINHTVLSTIFSSLIIAGVVISMMIFGSILLTL